MKIDGVIYNTQNLGKDFVFSVMWHTSPARQLSVKSAKDVVLAVNNAYRDMMPRTISGIGLTALDEIKTKGMSKEEKEEINKEKEAIKNKKRELFNNLRMELAEKIAKEVFVKERFDDNIHHNLCDFFKAELEAVAKELNDMLDSFEKRYGKKVGKIDTQKITYGKAQKIVNMTMKLLYCFDDANRYKKSVFINCHAPIDSIIIKFFCTESKTTPVWSKLDEDGYKDLQKKIRQDWKTITEKNGITGDFESLFFAEFAIWATMGRGSNVTKDNIKF